MIKMTEETKRKISESHKGKPSGMLGKHQSKEARSKISKFAKSRIGKLSGVYGKHWKVSEESILKRSGEKHFRWKGDNVGYRCLHSWIQRRLGKPMKCEYCSKKRTTQKSIDWANKDHSYKRNLIDWISLCRSCHKRYDLGKIWL